MIHFTRFDLRSFFLKGGVCMDVTKMDKIIEVNVEDFDCTLEPGVWRQGLNSYLRDTGLFFPIGELVLLKVLIIFIQS